MDLLSPLSRLLGFSQPPASQRTSQHTLQLSSAKPPSASASSKSLPEGSLRLAQAASEISPSLLTRSSLLHQLRTLSPQALRSFVSQRLPFLDDPHFALALARAIGEAQQSARNLSATTRRATNPKGRLGVNPKGNLGGNLGGEKAASEDKLKTSSEPPSKPAKLAESFQLRDRSGIIWRAWFLPIALEGRLERMVFYHAQKNRERGSGKDSGKGSSKGSGKQGRGQHRPSSRLVFAIDFSHTGPLEIEVEHSDGKLRVALRSMIGFSLAMRSSIQTRFLEILQDLDLQGQIVFHKVDQLAMSILSAEEERDTMEAVQHDELSTGDTTNESTNNTADETADETAGDTTWEIKL